MKQLPEFWFESRSWIDNNWVSGSESVAVKNPATGELICDVSLADNEAVHRAIDGSQRAFSDWRSTSPVVRGQILKRVASLLIERKDALATLLSAEQGKPFAQAAGEVDYAASFFQWYGEQSRRVYGRIAPHPESDREFLIEYRPIGVAGLITPWNFPLAQGAKKLAASLAAGCCSVWKPSELTPLIALAVGPILKEAGVPCGVVQITPALGPVAGDAFARSPYVRVISVTGSTATGRSVMTAASQNIKRVSLELGGNAPFLVLPDANMAFVADQLVRLKMLVSGQVCVTANRVFVHESVRDELIKLLVDGVNKVRVGNGLADGIEAGPLIHHKACAGVQALVDDAVSKGASVVAENRSFDLDPELSKGSFFAPTILTDVRDEMEITQREIFGPVIPILPFSRIEDVIARANATPHGLAAYVYGANLSQCRAIASSLDVGIVGVNEWRPLKAEIPFGGVKESGIGAEGGEEGILEFLDRQVISIPKPSIQ